MPIPAATEAARTASISLRSGLENVAAYWRLLPPFIGFTRLKGRPTGHPGPQRSVRIHLIKAVQSMLQGCVEACNHPSANDEPLFRTPTLINAHRWASETN